MDQPTNTGYVVVPDRQLSLAIGKEGQNARLAAKLTGWRIDIKSQAAFDALPEEEREMELAAAPALMSEPEPLEGEDKPAAGLVAAATRELTPEQEAVLAFQQERAAEQEAAAAAAEEDPAAVAEEATPSEPAKPQIRFAEEILGAERKAAQTKREEEEEEKARARRAARRPKRGYVEEEDEDDEFQYDIN
jgi:N utilization substance protein A